MTDMNKRNDDDLLWPSAYVGTPEQLLNCVTEMWRREKRVTVSAVLHAVIETLRAMPAVTVGVKPLVWDGVQGDCFIECETAIGTYALQVSDSLERECDWEWSATYRKHGQKEITIGQGKFQAAKDIAQADYEARILAALDAKP